MGTKARAVVRAVGAEVGVDVQDEAADRIVRYLDLLNVWNRRFHLTGERDPKTLLRKHAPDSLAPARLIPDVGTIVDVGSGAGFPGIILGCVRPEMDLVLVEPRRRPCSFLSEAARIIPLPRARVIEGRAEDAVSTLKATASVAISRALRLEVFLSLAKPLLRSDGFAIAMQTPHTDERVASDVANPLGFTLAEKLDYTLPDAGEPRRLLRFVHL